jgi:hypothetical protein
MGFGNPMGGNYAIHQVIFSRQSLRQRSACDWEEVSGLEPPTSTLRMQTGLFSDLGECA